MNIPRWSTIKYLGIAIILVACGIGFLVINGGNESAGTVIMIGGIAITFVMYIVFAIVRTTASAAGLAKDIKNRSAANRDNASNEDRNSK